MLNLALPLLSFLNSILPFSIVMPEALIQTGQLIAGLIMLAMALAIVVSIKKIDTKEQSSDFN